MPQTYLIHETMICEVTFVRRLEADDKTDAINGAYDGDGELLGISVGDAVSGLERTDIFEDTEINIPHHFYTEPE